MAEQDGNADFPSQFLLMKVGQGKEDEKKRKENFK